MTESMAAAPEKIPVPAIPPLDVEQIQLLWYEFCRTTYRRDLGESSQKEYRSPAQQKGRLVGEIRQKRETAFGRTRIDDTVIEQWFERHFKDVGRPGLEVSNDNLPKLEKGNYPAKDSKNLWSNLARWVLHFHLLGDAFRKPPGTPTVDDRTLELVGKIDQYFFGPESHFFDLNNVGVAGPTSLLEIRNERERRTFGLKNGFVISARVVVTSSAFDFLEEVTTTDQLGLGEASLDFMQANGKLVLIYPKDSAFPTHSAEALNSAAKSQNIAKNLTLRALDVSDNKVIDGEGFWAGEYLCKSWRYVLYETIYNKNPAPTELIFFLQDKDGEALSRFKVGGSEAETFAKWERAFCR